MCLGSVQLACAFMTRWSQMKPKASSASASLYNDLSFTNAFSGNYLDFQAAYQAASYAAEAEVERGGRFFIGNRLKNSTSPLAWNHAMRQALGGSGGGRVSRPHKVKPNIEVAKSKSRTFSGFIRVLVKSIGGFQPPREAVKICPELEPAGADQQALAQLRITLPTRHQKEECYKKGQITL